MFLKITASRTHLRASCGGLGEQHPWKGRGLRAQGLSGVQGQHPWPGARGRSPPEIFKGIECSGTHLRAIRKYEMINHKGVKLLNLTSKMTNRAYLEKTQTQATWLPAHGQSNLHIEKNKKKISEKRKEKRTKLGKFADVMDNLNYANQKILYIKINH